MSSADVETSCLQTSVLQGRWHSKVCLNRNITELPQAPFTQDAQLNQSEAYCMFHSTPRMFFQIPPNYFPVTSYNPEGGGGGEEGGGSAPELNVIRCNYFEGSFLEHL